MRVAIIAPVDGSPLAIATTVRCVREAGLEVVGVLIRRITLGRIRSELRRDGVVLLRKAWRAFALGAPPGADDARGLGGQLRALGVRERTVSAVAAGRGIPVLHTADVNGPQSVTFLSGIRPDVVLFTGGGLLRQPLLDVAGAGILNAHMGILPQYRGMDVVGWPLLEGRDPRDSVGLTLHFIDRGVDTGPVLFVRPLPPFPGETMETLHQRYLAAMADLLVEGACALRDGSVQPQPQRPDAGRQYFVMHPRLAAEARRRLALFTGAVPLEEPRG